MISNKKDDLVLAVSEDAPKSIVDKLEDAGFCVVAVGSQFYVNQDEKNEESLNKLKKHIEDMARDCVPDMVEDFTEEKKRFPYYHGKRRF